MDDLQAGWGVRHGCPIGIKFGLARRHSRCRRQHAIELKRIVGREALHLLRLASTRDTTRARGWFKLYMIIPFFIILRLSEGMTVPQTLCMQRLSTRWSSMSNFPSRRRFLLPPPPLKIFPRI